MKILISDNKTYCQDWGQSFHISSERKRSTT